MARRKNLLEAFQRSQGSAGSPVPAPPPSAEPSLPLFDRPAAHAARPRLAVGWPLAAVGVLLAFALGYVLGRGERPEARAEEPAVSGPGPSHQPRAFQQPPRTVPAPAAPSAAPATAPGSIEESALFDPANLFSVIVASYTKGRSSANQDLAWATYQHLKDEGLPVFPPVESGNLLVVLAGAAPTRAELEATETAVRALVRDGKKAYSDAYRVSIDKLIPRTKPGANPGDRSP